MKMKKLLAGVLSAAMVATMIPVSLAMSSVSAAPEDSLVASYDFTKGETEGWAEYSGSDFIEGDVDQITEDGNGVNFTEEGTYSYTIANPLQGKVTQDGGFTIAMDVQVTGTKDEFNGLFGFNAHSAGDFFAVTTNGATVRHNNTEGFYDIVDTTTDTGLGEMVRYVLTADSDSLDVYVNGSLVKSMAAGSGNTAYSIDAYNIANVSPYFNLGFNCYLYWVSPTTWWNNSTMTVANVSFYNTALSADDVASLGAYESEQPGEPEQPGEEPGGEEPEQPGGEEPVTPPAEEANIALSVVDSADDAADSYGEGDTVTVDVMATGNVDLGAYQFTLTYDKDLLQPILADDSDDPSVVVTNDTDKGIVALEVKLDGENSIQLSDTATKLCSISFEVLNVPENKGATTVTTSVSVSDPMFAYYDEDGIPVDYEVEPTVNDCTLNLLVSYGCEYDFNRDGSNPANVLDVMALAQIIVDKAPRDVEVLHYNVNNDEDGMVDVLDVMTLARGMVGLIDLPTE